MAKKVEIEKNDKLTELIKIIQDSDQADVEIRFKKGSNIYLNATNLVVLKRLAESYKKNLVFDVEDPNHKDFIESANNDTLNYEDTSIDLEHVSSELPEYKDHSEVSKKTKVKMKGAGILGIFAGVKAKVSGTSGEIGSEMYPGDQQASPKGNKKGLKKLIIIFISVILFFVAMFVLWWYIPSAEVKLAVNSEILVKLLEVKANTGQSSVNSEESSIPAYQIEVTETDTQTSPTSGQKEIGEYATGELTLFNKTDEDEKIKKGTKVKLIETDGESLLYETTEEVEIPAQKVETTAGTEGEISKTVYGNVSVKIKAQSFGDKYNVEKGNKFEIGDYDTDKVIGENDADIKGGSSETVNFVTQEDLDKLNKSLEEALKVKVLDSLNKKIVEGQSLPDNSVRYEILSTDYNAKAEDEKSDVTLTMSMKGSGLAYSKNDLDQLVSELITKVIPEEYSLNQESPDYEVAVLNVSEDQSSITLQVKLRSYITPNLDKAKIAEDLSGMGIDQAQEYLSGIENISGFEIVLSPKLPGFLRTMPHRPNNILINIQQ